MLLWHVFFPESSFRVFAVSCCSTLIDLCFHFYASCQHRCQSANQGGAQAGTAISLVARIMAQTAVYQCMYRGIGNWTGVPATPLDAFFCLCRAVDFGFTPLPCDLCKSRTQDSAHWIMLPCLADVPRCFSVSLPADRSTALSEDVREFFYIHTS